MWVGSQAGIIVKKWLIGIFKTTSKQRKVLFWPIIFFFLLLLFFFSAYLGSRFSLRRKRNECEAKNNRKEKKLEKKKKKRKERKTCMCYVKIFESHCLIYIHQEETTLDLQRLATTRGWPAVNRSPAQSLSKVTTWYSLPSQFMKPTFGV